MASLWLQLRMCVVCGGFEGREGRVQLPQTHLSSNCISGDWQLGARDRASPLTPTVIAQPSVCGGSCTICGCASVCVIEWIGSTASVMV